MIYTWHSGPYAAPLSHAAGSAVHGGGDGSFLPLQLLVGSPANSFEDASLGMTALLGRQAHPLV